MAGEDPGTIRREFGEAVTMTPADDLTDDDLAHVHKVHGYVQRHLAQEPERADIETSRWRYSLMNRRHDPLKKG